MKTQFARTLTLAFSFLLLAFSLSASTKRYYYQLKVYHYKTLDQEAKIERYLKNAYLPALHRAGIPNVGVFKTLKQDTADMRIYVFTPFTTLDKLTGIDKKLQEDT